jgi:hypothetical protein
VATGSCSKKRFVMTNKPQILQFTIQSGDRKAFVVKFVVTQRMWLDTTALACD